VRDFFNECFHRRVVENLAGFIEHFGQAVALEKFCLRMKVKSIKFHLPNNFEVFR
jgi:hypothetical protein